MITSWEYGTDFYGRIRTPAKVFLSNFIKVEDFKNSKYKEIIEGSLENIEYKVRGYQMQLQDINRTIRKENKKYKNKLDNKDISQEQYVRKFKELIEDKHKREIVWIEKIAEQQSEWNKISTKHANILK